MAGRPALKSALAIAAPVGIICAVSGCSKGRPGAERDAPRFVAERVRIVVLDDSLEVSGHYTFVAAPPGARAIPMLYPYPSDSLLGGATTIELALREQGGGWSPIAFAEKPRLPGARWLIPPVASDTFEVRTRYRQQRRADCLRYITTTPRTWGAPLTRARFEIVLPADAVDPCFSHDFERVDERAPYVYQARPFAGERDIVATWSRRE